MAITYTGKTSEPLGGKNFQAKDNVTNATFPVKVSSEAIQDHGEFACRQKGDEKHTNGDVEQDGSIIVGTADFK